MYSLFRKEINSFFGSVTGYLVITVFLLVNGLFLWVIPGYFNIIDGGYATLNGLFDMAPWIYLLLIPAITMRLIAEERKAGTMELLLTRPLSGWQIILGKYWAAVVLVILSLVPTLVSFWAVYQLGNPVGNMDIGATVGSYLGLFFLAAIYCAIGLFCSTVTTNQVVAFIYAIVLSFFFYIGFDYLADLTSGNLQLILSEFSISEHYKSISRGVVDTRDLVYFIATIGLLLKGSALLIGLQKDRISWKKIGVIIAVFGGALFLGNKVFARFDLTSEKKFTLSELTKQLLDDQKKPIMVEIFLGGEVPGGFRNLQQAIVEKIEDLDAYSSFAIHYRLINPYTVVASKDRQKYFEKLIKKGLEPTEVKRKSDDGMQTMTIFPGVILRKGNDEVALNLLKNNPLLNHEINLNHSIETLEYEFARGLQLIDQEKKTKIAYLTGQAEMDKWETMDFTVRLGENYHIERITTDSLLVDIDQYKTLIIASPNHPFSEKDKYAIDQYIMQGGRTLWLFDPVQVSLDSLERGDVTLAFPRDLKLNDQLFRYGVRVNPNLIQDVQCLQIPIVAELSNGQTKQIPASWFYSPLLTPVQNHVIGRNMNLVKSEFVSSVEKVGNNKQLQHAVILTTSRYARRLPTPQNIALSSVNAPPAKKLFHESYIPVGMLVEGKFSSPFENRILNFERLKDERFESKENKMIVIADGSIIGNKVRRKPGEQTVYQRLGYDRYSKRTFGNKEFLVNAVNYLCDDCGLMQLRSRVVKMRLLDKVKIRENKLMWQLTSVLIPVVLFILGGFLYAFYRKKKYSA